MPTEKLKPDSDSQAKWEKLAKNAPSKEALPPMTGGMRWVWWFIIILIIVVIFGLLQGRG